MRPTTMSQAFEERHNESAAQSRRIFFGLGSPEHASGGIDTVKRRIGDGQEGDQLAGEEFGQQMEVP